MSENNTPDAEPLASGHGTVDESAVNADLASRVSGREKLRARLATLLTPAGLMRAAKAVAYRAFRLTGEFTAIVLGLSFAWMCIVNIVIAKRVMDVSFLEADAARFFSKAYAGKKATVGKMTLSWEAADNTVIFRAKDIAVLDKAGGQLSALSGVETELALRDVAKARFDPLRMIIDGGELSWLRGKDGTFTAGLGTPETVGLFGPVWRGEKRASAEALKIGKLETLTIKNAKIYIRDELSDYSAQLRDTQVNVDMEHDKFSFEMQASLMANRDSAPITLSGTLSSDWENFELSVDAAQFNPAKLLPDAGGFAALKRIDAPLDFDAHMLAKRGQGLETLAVNMSAGAGHIVYAGRAEPFTSARLTAGYDPASEQLDITTLAIDSAPIAFDGIAKLSHIGSPATGLFSKNTAFDVQLSTLDWDGNAANIAPIAASNVRFIGEVLRADNQIRLDRISADMGSYQPRFTGLITRADEGKLSAVLLSGKIGGTVSREQLLALWPESLIAGARRWVERSVLTANLSNFDIRFDADADVLAGRPLKDENLRLAFDLDAGQLRYISTMTPIIDAVGKGIVLGNQVEFGLETGRVDDVALERATITIPRIYPYGGDMIIDIDASGPLTTLVGLLDQKPFEYVTPYGVSPQDFGGHGQINLNITRPLRSTVSLDRVDYHITGDFTGVSAPFSLGENKMHNGVLSLSANKQGLELAGPINVGPWRAQAVWQEVFDKGATPTKYSFSGKLSPSDLDSFGIGLREFIGGGDIALSIEAVADGLAISSADIRADLTDTDMAIGPYWDKPKGVSALMSGVMSLSPDKQLSLRDMTIRSTGLELLGQLDMGADYTLRNLTLKRAKVNGFIDAAVQVKPGPERDRFDIFITGDYLDISPFVSSAIGGSGGAIDVPILLSAALERLALNPSYVLRNANILYAHNGYGVTQARLKGDMGQGAGPFVVDLTTGEAGDMRVLNVDIPDASDAAFAFLNLKSIAGGRLQLSADLPAVGSLQQAVGAVTGKAEIEAVKLVNAPIMTTILSLASLEGLSNALGGGGLDFDSVHIPFSYEKGRLSIREATATGIGIGMTGNGEIGFDSKSLDFDGVLVPAYRANSMLGSIPVIGDIFVGKKGEGIFALNYTVQGPFSNAQVAVNPLSALTPGFLRGIFAPKRDDLPEQLSEQLRDSIEAVRPQTAEPPQQP